ncbi:leucine-rich repeat extensin-like protein 2 [Oryza brachyantha]|uniref:leucine-rich repeat extensin-like protein 2 n=1 Tax=Oryza brachyantha TaxID=4533 RepID=UPI001ADAE154|nr:leucine-rich repeat extensin-like protein 2 [Oryza brachyantha]
MDSVPPAGVGGAVGPGYPESTESSPRSRGGDSWDEFPSSAAAAAAAAGAGRLRLMCSFGGRIVPRPTDKSLCYLGGETRIVAVERNATLADVHARLSRSLLAGQPFTLKYQLPNEDLDSLISVSTDEDLDNLVDEYDRIAATSSGGGSSRTSRIRLFLFPAKPESSSSLGSLLDDSSKSESWFVDALNSAISGSLDGIPRGISTDSASVNCLLGLEDDSSTHSRGGPPNSAPAEEQRANQQKLAAAAAVAAARHPHDVQSVPDSPMIDKNSSFGSTSSAPSLSNLPPIRVRPEDRPPDSRVAAPIPVEDHFAQMGISDHPVPPVGAYMQPPPQVPIPNMAVPSISPSDASSRVFSDDDKSDHGGGARKPQPPKQEVPPVADPTNRAMYYNDRSPPAELKREMPVGTDAASYRVPVPTQDAAAAAAAVAAAAPQPPAGYVYAQMHAPPPPQQQHPPQQQQQPVPQQYVTPQNQHFIHNPATGTFIPIQSYYHHPVPQQAPQPPIPQPVPQPQQSAAFDPNTGMYYIPMRPNAPQAYSMPPGATAVPPPTLVDTTPKPTVPIPQMGVKQPELQQPGLYRTTAAPAPVPASNAAPAYAGMGYHHVIQSHHHPAPQPAATMAGNFGYEYGDPTRAQVFYSQAAPPPTLPPQYQPMGSPDAGQADLKQARAS